MPAAVWSSIRFEEWGKGGSGVSLPSDPHAVKNTDGRPPGAGWGRRRLLPEGLTVAARISAEHPIRDLFGSLVQRAFAGHLRLTDPELARYIANVLVDFTHRDQ